MNENVKKLVIVIGILAVVFVAGFFLTGANETGMLTADAVDKPIQLHTEEEFNDASYDCVPSVYTQETDGYKQNITIHGMRDDECEFTVYMDDINEDAPELMVYHNALRESIIGHEGLEMTCRMDPKEYVGISGLEKCEGALANQVKQTTALLAEYAEMMKVTSTQCFPRTLWNRAESVHEVKGIQLVDGQPLCENAFTLSMPGVVELTVSDRWNILGHAPRFKIESVDKTLSGCTNESNWMYYDDRGSVSGEIIANNGNECVVGFEVDPLPGHFDDYSVRVIVSESGTADIAIRAGTDESKHGTYGGDGT